MADSLESVRQHMQQEALDEGLRRHTERAPAVAVGRISHPQTHRVPIHTEDALVGDGHPMRIGRLSCRDRARSSG